jgi:hypothetical protein
LFSLSRSYFFFLSRVSLLVLFCFSFSILFPLFVYSFICLFIVLIKMGWLFWTLKKHNLFAPYVHVICTPCSCYFIFIC